MLEHYCQSIFSKVCVMPVLGMMAPRVSPFFITMIALVSGLSVVPALYFNVPLLAVFLLLISGYCDVLDGALARELKQSGALGAVYDIVTDRIVEFSCLLGLFLQAPQSRGLVIILMLGATLVCVTSFLVVGIFSENVSHKSFHYSPGLMERAEAFIFFIVMVLWPGKFELLGIFYTLCVIWTAVSRVYAFQKKMG